MLKDLKEILKGHPRLFFAVVTAVIIGVFASTCASMAQCVSSAIEITNGDSASDERVLGGDEGNSGDQPQEEGSSENSEQPNSLPSRQSSGQSSELARISLSDVNPVFGSQTMMTMSGREEDVLGTRHVDGFVVYFDDTSNQVKEVEFDNRDGGLKSFTCNLYTPYKSNENGAFVFDIQGDSGSLLDGEIRVDRRVGCYSVLGVDVEKSSVINLVFKNDGKYGPVPDGFYTSSVIAGVGEAYFTADSALL